MKTYIYVLVGLPGSGKTTWAKDQCELFATDGLTYRCINRDDIRKALARNGENPFAREKQTRTKFALDIAEAIESRVDVIIVDASNITMRRRRRILEIIDAAKKHFTREFVAVGVNFVIPYDECLKRNKERKEGIIVPENVMKNMGEHMTYAELAEGFDEIWEVG